MNQYPVNPMNDVYSVLVHRSRPGVLVIAAWLWSVHAVLLLIGTPLREMIVWRNPAEGDQWTPVAMALIISGLAILAIGEVWLSVLMVGGNWYARLALAFVGVVLEVFAVVELIGTAYLGIGYQGGAAVVAWTLLIIRVVLPPIPFVLSFLPSANSYLGAGR